MRGVFFGVVLGVLISAGCGPKPANAPANIDVIIPGQIAPNELPKSPIDLTEPPVPSAEIGGTDASKLSARELSEMASRAANRKDNKTAVAAEYWAVKAGGGDMYKLACDYARLKEVDAALYWLIQTATKQGLDMTHVTSDNDLAQVWLDPRYDEKVYPFLADCVAYFKAHGRSSTVVYLPKGFDKSKPTPVIVYLHERVGRPEDFLGPETQVLADASGIPVIGVSGTVPLGPKSFVWAVDSTQDAKRIADALKTAADKVTIAPGKVIALGFSEGAQVGLDAAVRDSATFAGAIAISPAAEFKLENVTPPPKSGRFVITMGTKETWNRGVVKKDRDFLSAANLPLQYVEIPNVGTVFPRTS